MTTKKVRAPRSTAKQEKRANGQGSIYFDRDKNRYIVAVPDYSRPERRRKRSFYTKKEADIFLHEYISNKGLGKASFAANPRIKVGEFLDSWHGTVKKEAETVRSYSTVIKNWIKPHVGNVRVADVTPAIIENLYNTLDDLGFSNSVLHLTHIVFSRAFKDAMRLGLISYNPMSSVKKLSKRSIPSRHIPKREADLIYAVATEDPYLHARIELGMLKAIRPGEVLGLKWDDIDWGMRTMTIERQLQRQTGVGLVFKALKTHNTRVLPLSKDQIAILQVHKLAQETAKVFWQEDHKLLFPNSFGMPKDTKADHRDWKVLLKKAGVDQKFTRYQMRKTAITNHITHGVDEKTTATIAGHSSPSVTMKHYANATTTSMLAALDVEDAFRPSLDQIRSMNQVKLEMEGN